MKHDILSRVVLALTLLMAVALSSCSGNSGAGDAGDSDVSTVTCRISSRAASGEEVAALPNERINSWWVVFADKSGTVREIVRNDASLNEPVDRDEATVRLPAGDYSIYAFANITAEELEHSTGVGFAVGETVAPDVASACWKAFSGSLPAGSLIPMSGVMQVAFRNSRHDISIELVRMFAKIEIEFENTSAGDFMLDSFSFGLLNKGDLPLFPDYGSLAQCPDILPSARTQKEELSFAGLSATVPPGGSYEAVFYVRESAAAYTHPTERYFITFAMRGAGESEAREHYAVTDGLSWIQRNDYIRIPVRISDMTVDWSVLFYPPIGGYPAVVGRVEGDSHFFTFGSGGKFRIRPEVRKSDGTALAPANLDFEIADIEGDSSIFSTLPAKDPVTGEITGELSGLAGSAVLDCILTVDDGVRRQSRMRKVYIIKD